MKKILVLLALLLASPAAATPAITQLGTANGTTTAVITTTANVAAGDLVVVVATNGTNNTALISVVDSAANCTTYTVATSTNVPVAARPTNAIFYCTNSGALASGGTITVTGGALEKIAATAFTVSDMATSSVLDITNTINGASNVTSSPGITPATLSQNYNLFLGTLSLGNSSGGILSVPGLANIGGISSGNGSAYSYYLFTCTSVSGTNATFNWTSTRAYMSSVAIFKANSAPSNCATNKFPLHSFPP